MHQCAEPSDHIPFSGDRQQTNYFSTDNTSEQLWLRDVILPYIFVAAHPSASPKQVILLQIFFSTSKPTHHQYEMLDIVRLSYIRNINVHTSMFS